MRPLTEEQRARFWSRATESPAGCMEWQLHRDKDGYGRAKVNGEEWSAHRLAWTLTNGPIPAGMIVCHRCDNPPCFNPQHLFLGTTLDNNRDSAAKNRSAIRRYPDRYGGKPGEQNGIAKLTASAVLDIQRRYAAGGISQQRLADEYGVHQGTISKVILGKSWTHVEGAA